MPQARKPQPHPTDNLMLIVGQLLEAAKAASDGLKSMSMEVQSNAKAIIAAVGTIEKVEEKVAELDDVISDASNPHNLRTVTQGHATQLLGLRDSVRDLRDTLEELKKQVGALGLHTQNFSTASSTVWEVAKVAGWLITTGIAVYAAVGGK